MGARHLIAFGLAAFCWFCAVTLLVGLATEITWLFARAQL